MSDRALIAAAELAKVGRLDEAAAAARDLARAGDARATQLWHHVETSRGDDMGSLAAASLWTEQRPRAAEAWCALAAARQAIGVDAEVALARALAIDPDCRHALHMMADRHFDAGRPADAEPFYRRVAEAAEDEPAGRARIRLSLCRQAAGRPQEELAELDHAMRLLGSHPDLQVSAGMALTAIGQHDMAEARFRAALDSNRDLIEARVGLGIALVNQERFAAAVPELEHALEAAPGNPTARYYLAVALGSIERYRESLDQVSAVLRANPDDVPALVWAGHCCLQLKRADEGKRHFGRALELNPEDRPVRLRIARSWEQGQAPEEVAAILAPWLARHPDDDEALIALANARIQACDWTDYEATKGKIVAAVDRVAGLLERSRIGLAAAMDMAKLLATYGVDYGPAMTLARALANAIAAPRAADRAAIRFGSRPSGKIRIAYLVAAAVWHSTQLAVKNLAERHDRSRFEVGCYVLRRKKDPHGDGRFAERFAAAFDRFAYLDDVAEAEAAARIRGDGIDIVVEMHGLHTETGLYLLARRVAPIQCHYYGWAYSTGADWVDYLLVDRVYMPPRLAVQCSEKTVYLPDSFMAPTLGTMSDKPLTRAQLDLPEGAFVFCDFNHPWKHEPETFAQWMALLRDVPGSVLWLGTWRGDAKRNLLAEAKRAGIDPARLVFAPIADHPDHLRRLTLADLALDNLHTQGGVTTQDALYAGLPVLTAVGVANTPSARLGASLISAAGLPELIAAGRSDYAAKALALARDRGRLAALRRRLVESRATAPLFDIAGATRSLEAAYTGMVERWRAGLPPESFAVDRSP